MSSRGTLDIGEPKFKPYANRFIRFILGLIHVYVSRPSYVLPVFFGFCLIIRFRNVKLRKKLSWAAQTKPYTLHPTPYALRPTLCTATLNPNPEALRHTP